MDKPEVKLIGEDGNAFLIIGKVVKALRKADFEFEYIQKYQEEATSGDYDHLLRVTMKYIDIV